MNDNLLFLSVEPTSTKYIISLFISFFKQKSTLCANFIYLFYFFLSRANQNRGFIILPLIAKIQKSPNKKAQVT